jgi:AraC-like DNA-binding protein
VRVCCWAWDHGAGSGPSRSWTKFTCVEVPAEAQVAGGYAGGPWIVTVGFCTVVVMAQDAERQRGERVRVERARTPPISLEADPRLRSLVGQEYGGHDDASLPQDDYVIPATLVTWLVVKVGDQRLHPPVLVNGASGTYTRIAAPCASLIRVNLAPLGAYRLLGPTVSEIGGLLVGLEDIVGAKARRLSEQVMSAPTWEQRGRLVDDYLLDLATRGPQPSPEVSHAMYLLKHSGGRDPIREIARQVGWSHKHLITKFKQQVGVTPHTAARLLRLNTVWRHLDHKQTWARIAAESGYTDQSHLIREFRQFTGTTPGALTTT